METEMIKVVRDEQVGNAGPTRWLQGVAVLMAKPEDLNSIPKTHEMGGGDQFPRGPLSSDLYSSDVHSCPAPHANEINKV